ncbi:hypothetical protein SLEP1_g54464 [Rubroshorea leprosula]|uniref:Uncharacterized protein n=1 Tax=Rubroshorea leprosula TaxID=152421 RepID=A0AAV5MFD0_9ROSI|nr:hypothetical protein SLEP1_g54464 [Rubroshorea leprosula]
MENGWFCNSSRTWISESNSFSMKILCFAVGITVACVHSV